MPMKRASYDRMIRKLRSGMCFPTSDGRWTDAHADRAHALLGRLLAAKAAACPHQEPVDATGHTASDRAVLARNGLSIADFM